MCQSLVSSLIGTPFLSKTVFLSGGASGEVIFEARENAGTVAADIPRGVQYVSVVLAGDGASAEGVVESGADGTRLRLPIVVELLATVQGPDSAPAGSDVRVSWTGPDEDRDYIAIADPGASGSIN